MLNKRFIDQAIRIRKDYLECVKNVVECENRINYHKNELLKIQNQLDTIIDQFEIREKMIGIEKSIHMIEKELSPHFKKIDNLEKDANLLYEIIKENHPDITGDEIKNEIYPFIKDLK